MPRIPFAQYAPDVSDNEAETSRNILNVFPQGDGYGPVPGLVAASLALSAQCRGSFTATNPDGTLVQFAGITNKLYANTSGGAWQEVTRSTGGIKTGTTSTAITNAGTGGTNGTYTAVPITGGSGTGAVATFTVSGNVVTSINVTTAGSGYKTSDIGLSASSASIGNTTGLTFSVTLLSSNVLSNYTALASDAQWEFCQFNSTVIATQGNDNVQAILLPVQTGSYFADLLGSPPKAGACAVVNRFIVLSQLTANPTRIQWCDLDAITTWTAGTGQADFQDLPDGGNVQGVAGFDLYGVILQDRRARLMTYISGDIVFQITSVTGGDGNGIYAPYAFASGSDRVFWLSNQGFKMLLPGSEPTPIGKERVDRTFLASFGGLTTSLELQNVLAVTDPSENRVYFSWPKTFNSAQFDSVLVYDWVLDRWTRLNIALEFICTAPTTYNSSLNPKIVLGGFSTGHVLESFNSSVPNNGAGLEAQLETPEQGTDGQRIYVRGFRPISDAQLIYGSISYRDTTAQLSTGSITGITITNSGSGGVAGSYTGISLTGGSGTGAVATIGIAASTVVSVEITSGGNGYAMSSLRTLTISAAGSGGTPATYNGVALTGGTGSGATANITVGGGGAVTAVTIVNRGTGYLMSDTLSAASANIGNTTGVSFTVADLADTGALSATVGGVTGFTMEVNSLGPNYTSEATMNQTTGIIPFRKETRYSRAKIRIPVNTVWSFARGVEPDGALGGFR